MACLTAGFGGLASAQDDGQQPAQTFELTGVADAWIGQSPSSIQGKRNPTLKLQAGKKYRIRWTNGDGLSHNVAIYDRDGNLLVHSPYTHKKGAVQNVDFTATQGMIDYYCEVHYLSMRGTVDVSGTSPKKEQPVAAGFFETGPTVGLTKVADGLIYHLHRDRKREQEPPVHRRPPGENLRSHRQERTPEGTAPRPQQ